MRVKNSNAASDLIFFGAQVKDLNASFERHSYSQATTETSWPSPARAIGLGDHGRDGKSASASKCLKRRNGKFRSAAENDAQGHGCERGGYQVPALVSLRILPPDQVAPQRMLKILDRRGRR